MGTVGKVPQEIVDFLESIDYGVFFSILNLKREPCGFWYCRCIEKEFPKFPLICKGIAEFYPFMHPFPAPCKELKHFLLTTDKNVFAFKEITGGYLCLAAHKEVLPGLVIGAIKRLEDLIKETKYRFEVGVSFKDLAQVPSPEMYILDKQQRGENEN